MDINKLNGQILWDSDCNVLPCSLKLYNINEYYKYKFKLLGEELIALANKQNKECVIDIRIKYTEMDNGN